MGEHMKKRVYIPNAGSSSSPRPTASASLKPTPSVNQDLPTRPEERTQQSAPDKLQRLREQILRRPLQHQPAPIGTLGPIEFDRCVCGFTLARYEGRTYWIRVQSPDGHEPAIRDVSEPKELAYALRTACWGSLDLKAIKQLLGEQNALNEQKSRPAPA
jgi:hypothetical protein